MFYRLMRWITNPFKIVWVNYVIWRERRRAVTRSKQATELMGKLFACELKLDSPEAIEEVKKIIDGYELVCKPNCKKCHGRGYIGVGADGMGIPCKHARAVRVG